MSVENPGPHPAKRAKKSPSSDRNTGESIDSDPLNPLNSHGSDDELLQLQWNNHSSSFGAALGEFRLNS